MQTRTKEVKPSKGKLISGIHTGGPIRCYNCGETGHRSNECKSKKDGAKCLKCNNLGNKSFECRKKQNSQDKTTSSTDNAKVHKIEVEYSENMNKTMTIQNAELTALVDTGCSVNLIREDVLPSIGLIIQENTDITLNGFGGSKVKALAKFEYEVKVYNEKFSCVMYIVPDNK